LKLLRTVQPTVDIYIRETKRNKIRLIIFNMGELIDVYKVHGGKQIFYNYCVIILMKNTIK
jgi:hypothetical protein